MLDLKWIRNHPKALDRALEKRGLRPLSDLLLQQDALHREALSKLERVRALKNTLDDEIAQRKAKKMDCEDYFARATLLKKEEGGYAEDVKYYYEELYKHLSELPNVPAEDVPVATGEQGNIEVFRYGIPADKAWRKDHVALGRMRKELDLEQAAKNSGARFVYLSGGIARLERALGQWMLDTHTQKFGYTELYAPLLMKEASFFGAGQLPKFRDDLFCTTTGLFLIPTAEVPLLNWARDRIFLPEELPLRLTALTPCFRSEAGSAGRDTHGILRQHQFNKVEMFIFCAAEEAAKHHEAMTSQAEYLLQALELPYRKMLLCSGDMGHAAQKTYDLEVWIPSEQTYREISSCSDCGAYQARRIQAKVRGIHGELDYVHTLNGSGLPTGRALLAILEQYQCEDGNVTIPMVLRPYMGGNSSLNGVCSG